MLDGWYCRTMANQQQSLDQNDQEDERPHHRQPQHHSGSEEESQVVSNMLGNQRTDYKSQYTNLKKKLKFLLYVSSLAFDARS